MSDTMRIKDLAVMFGVGEETLRKRLLYVGVKPAVNGLVNGRTASFYDVDKVKDAIANRLQRRETVKDGPKCKVASLEDAVKANRGLGMSICAIARRVHERPETVTRILFAAGML